jgi:hypothetical protein
MAAVRDRWEAMAARERMIIVALAGVIVLALVWLLFLRGGGGDIEGFQGGPTITRSPTPRATTTPTPVPETFEVFEGKDPFRPLVAPTQGSPAPQPTDSPGGSPQPSAEPTPGQRVELVEIFTQNGTRYATVEVNGKSYTVKEGDTFADNYRVLDLTAECGTFVFGDERFTLCVGQEVLK